ncbi:MAG: pyrroloquinoline quinone-dependent dehydrogenase [Bryobacterales bacterium]
MSCLRFILVSTLCAAALPGQTDWPVFGHDPGAMRYSPLKQINTKNISRLERAWTFHSGKPGSEATPVVVDGVMYLTQPNGIFALEPETGKLIWHFETENAAALRGLTYWPGNRVTHPRVLSGVRDKLVAIDVTTGKPAPGFGKEGFVDLREGVLGDMPKARLSLDSPPAVYKDVIITGSTNGEGAPSRGAYGDIRGWDAHTGKLLWTFHTVPRPGEPGNETWPEDGWRNRTGTNTWGYLTVDVERGLVFAPTGSPTSDFYGADRHGDGLYGNSLIALDAATGKLKWHQQLVHHDIWDYDLAAPPALFEVNRNGKKIPAVAQITKMGILFVFNRVTGEPMYGMEERPVPQTVVPGEKTSPTQPFPLKPPPLARNTFREEEMYNLTPEHAAFCRDLYERNNMLIGVPYTPTPLEGNMLIFPSTLGGGNWGGVSVDPTLGYLFVNVMNVGQFGHMEKSVDKETGEVTYVRKSEYGPYARFWNRDSRIPCTNPPFGELVAVNVNTGDIAWKTPLGTINALEALGVKNTGTLSLGGSINTAGGLLFIAATNDSRFRAFESKTGRLLWEQPIEANGHAIPITYRGKNGKQYVAIMAAGGGGFFGGPLSDTLVAYALGDGSKPAELSAAPQTTTANTQTAAAERTGSAAASTGSSGASRPLTVLPDDSGKALVQQSCGKQCHGIEIVTSQRMGRAEWKTVVDVMIARGATGTNEDWRLILDYLSKHLGR